MAPRRSRNRRRRRPAGVRERRRRLVSRLLAPGAVLGVLAVILIAAVSMSGGDAAASPAQVRVIPIDGVIDPVMADFVTGNIDQARQDKVQAIVLELDTPGGLDESMRQIIKKMESTPLPVIAYVAPSGARAASAGTFICMAADVAAMAPGTNLGAAHPVGIGADPSTEEGRKVINDAAAYIRSLAQANDRNADWAELAVRQSVSLTADDALSQKVIDFKADNLNSLLNQINGFKTKAKGITLKTAGAATSEAGMSLQEKFLHLLLDPNVAYLLFILGLIAIAYEFLHPGVSIGAIIGVIALIMSFYALYILPVNYVGVALILLGVILFAAELYVPAHGALTLGGAASLLIGSLFLFNTSASFLKVSLALDIVLAALAAAFFVFVARAAFRARRLPARNPKSALIGMTGVTRTDLAPLGQVFVNGEIWSAESEAGESIEKGEEVEVTGVSGLMLKVRKT